MITDRNTTTYRGFVITDRGNVLVQLPADNEWGFSLHSDDQEWPGGLGIADEWGGVDASDPRITDDEREELFWLLDEPDNSDDD